jgi:urease accessory protein
MLSTLLLLADGRLPAGGHAHSGGLEEAVAAGRVAGAGELASYLAGRLVTTGRVDAALAALAAMPASPPTSVLDGEAAARCPSAALRRASRAQGRGLVRAARRMWPDDGLDEIVRSRAGGLMWPVALGRVAAAAGLGPAEAAAVAAHAAISGAGWAATRLLGMDPFAVAAILAGLSPAVDAEAQAALMWARPGVDPADLPAPTAPLCDIGAEAHAQWEVRLFAS